MARPTSMQLSVNGGVERSLLLTGAAQRKMSEAIRDSVTSFSIVSDPSDDATRVRVVMGVDMAPIEHAAASIARNREAVLLVGGASGASADSVNFHKPKHEWDPWAPMRTGYDYSSSVGFTPGGYSRPPFFEAACRYTIPRDAYVGVRDIKRDEIKYRAQRSLRDKPKNQYATRDVELFEWAIDFAREEVQHAREELVAAVEDATNHMRSEASRSSMPSSYMLALQAFRDMADALRKRYEVRGSPR